MAIAGNVIKEYLVGLGFKVDDKTLRSAQNSMKAMEKSVMGFVGVMSAAAVGIAKFIEASFKKEQQLEQDAKAQKKTIETMRAETNALQVLGVTADQLRKDPALKAIAKDLENLGRSMALPEGAQGLKTVDNLMKAFQRFQVSTKYLVDWSFYQIKNIAARPLNTLAQYLGKASAFIGKNIAKISEGVGIGVKFVAAFFANLVRIFGALGSLLGKIPGPIKAIGLAIAAVFAINRAGPIGWIATAVAAVTLLDDLFTYLDGGEALFGKFWGACVSGVKKAKAAIDKVVLIFKAFWRNILSAAREGDWAKAGANIVNGIKTAFRRVGNLLKTAILGEDNFWNTDATWDEVGQKILDGIGGAFSKAGDWLKETGALIWNKIKAGFTNANAFLKGLFAGEDSQGKSWAQIGGDIWTGIKKGVRDASNLVKDWLANLFKLPPGATWSEVGSSVWTAIVNGVKGLTDRALDWLGDLFKLPENTTWSEVGSSVWTAIVNGVSSAIKGAGDWLSGLFTKQKLDASEIAEITGSFSVPTSLKFKEAGEARDDDVDGLNTYMGELQGRIDQRLIAIKFGVELASKEFANVGDWIDSLVTAGIKAIESKKYNIDLNLATLTEVGVQGIEGISENLFNPFFESINQLAAEKGQAVMSYYVDAMADGSLTPEEAAKIAIMTKEFEAEVAKAIGEIEIKAKFLRLSIEKTRLDPGDIKGIVNQTNDTVQEAFDAASVAHEETITVAYQASVQLNLSPEETKKNIDALNKAYRDEKTEIALEGLNSIFSATDDVLRKGSLVNHTKAVFDELFDMYEGNAEEVLSSLPSAYDSIMVRTGHIFGNKIPELLPEMRENARALLVALRPNREDLNELAKLYEEAGEEMDEGLVAGIKRINYLDALSGSNSEMFRFVLNEVQNYVREYGITFEEAYSLVVQDISDTLSKDLTLEGLDEKIDTAKQDVATKLGEGTIHADAKADLDVEVTAVNAEMTDAGEEGKQAYSDALEGAGTEAGQIINAELEEEKPAIVNTLESIAAESVQKFLETLSASQAAEIAKAFGDGIVEGLQEAYDRVLEIWNEFPKDMRGIFQKAKEFAYNAFKAITERMRSIKQSVVNLFGSLPDEIGGKFEEAAKKAEAAFAGLADDIAGKMSAIKDSIAGAVGAGAGDSGVEGGKGLLARNAVGGVYDSPTETLVGEEGRREYVIPTAYPDRAIPMLRALMSDMGISAESLQRANGMLGSGAETFARPAQMQSMINNSSTTNSRQTTTNNQITAPVNVTVTGYGNNAAQISNQIDSQMRRHIRNLRGRIVTA